MKFIGSVFFLRRNGGKTVQASVTQKQELRKLKVPTHHKSNILVRVLNGKLVNYDFVSRQLECIVKVKSYNNTVFFICLKIMLTRRSKAKSRLCFLELQSFDQPFCTNEKLFVLPDIL